MTRWFLRFAGVLIMFGAFSCRGGCSGDSLAVLIGVNGTVQRDFAASIGDWEAATVSAKFKFDDGVSTGKESSAELELDDGATAMLESNTTVRFRSTNDQPSLDVEMGAALIETKASGLVLDTEIGSATILAGSRVYIRRKGGKIRFEVSVGRANFETLDGKTMEVGAGQKLLVDIGNAVIEIEVPEPVPELKSEPEPEPEIIEEIPTGPVSASISGRGATMKAPGSKKWEVLKKGPNQLPEGSTLKLPRGVNADLQHGSMTATLRGSGNFVVAPAPGVLVEAQSGSLALTGAEGTVRVTVPGGSIIAKPLARADVTVRRKDTKISVIAGEVRLESEEGSQDLARVLERLVVGSDDDGDEDHPRARADDLAVDLRRGLDLLEVQRLEVQRWPHDGGEIGDLRGVEEIGSGPHVAALLRPNGACRDLPALPSAAPGPTAVREDPACGSVRG